MRWIAMGLLAAASCVAGCVGLSETLGWNEVTRDLSGNTTKAGEKFLPNQEKKDKFIVVESFALDLASSPAKVKMVLRNDAGLDDYSADLEFGYPSAPGSIADHVSDIVGVPLPNFDTGPNAKRTVEVIAPSGHSDPPGFARLKFLTGTDIPYTAARENTSTAVRRGSLYVNERVEVTGMVCDLTSAKPVLKFTLMNIDQAHPDEEIGTLDYRIELYGRDGKLFGTVGDSLPMTYKRVYRWKTLDKPLQGCGSTAEITEESLPAAEGGYAGVKPVLRVVKR